MRIVGNRELANKNELREFSHTDNLAFFSHPRFCSDPTLFCLFCSSWKVSKLMVKLIFEPESIETTLWHIFTEFFQPKVLV